MKYVSKVLIVVLVINLMVFSFMVGFGLQKVKAADKLTDFELFWEVIDLLENEYVDEVKDYTSLIYGAIKGMLESLGDDYTRFLEPQAYKEMQVETKGEFGGVGIQIDIRDKKLMVISPLPGTPAEKAGLRSGDWIQKINGESTKNISLQEAVTKIRGERGTKVILTILHQGEKKPKDYEIIRDIIKIQSVSAKMVAKNIGYVKINIFNEHTDDELKTALKRLQGYNLEGLVLDLRFNPGGLLESAIEVANRFMREGAIVRIETKKGKKQTTIYADKKDVFPRLPMVILVNGYSASAAEIVTGALQDYGLAVVVGSKFEEDEVMKTGRTFGKGSVQTVHPLRDGSAVAITTARYFTAKGRDINKKGIEPDVIVNLTKEDFEKKTDRQLGKAKEIINKLIVEKNKRKPDEKVRIKKRIKEGKKKYYNYKAA